MIPLILPVHVSPPRCPSCGQPEDTVVRCRHCDYAYRAEGASLPEGALFVGLSVGGVALLISLLMWSAFTVSDWQQSSDTLFHVIGQQWTDFWRLLHRIW